MNYRFWWWFHWCQGCFFWDLSANLQPLSIWTGNILRQCLLSWSVCFTYFSYTIWFQPKIERMWSRWLRYILYMYYERGLKQAHEGSDHPSFMLIVRAFSATRKNRAYTTDEYKEVCLRRLEMIFQHCWNRSGGLLTPPWMFLRLFGELNDWDDRGQILIPHHRDEPCISSSSLSQWPIFENFWVWHIFCVGKKTGCQLFMSLSEMAQ